MTRRLAIVAFVALVAVGGCGDDQGEPQRTTPAPQAPQAEPLDREQLDVFGAVDALSQASERGDGGAVCDRLLTAAAARSLARRAGGDCPRAVERTLLKRGASFAISKPIEVSGRRATTELTRSDGPVISLTLRQVDGSWRISRIERSRS